MNPKRLLRKFKSSKKAWKANKQIEKLHQEVIDELKKAVKRPKRKTKG